MHLQKFTANIFNDKMMKALTLRTKQGCTLVTISGQHYQRDSSIRKKKKNNLNGLGSTVIIHRCHDCLPRKPKILFI